MNVGAHTGPGMPGPATRHCSLCPTLFLPCGLGNRIDQHTKSWLTFPAGPFPNDRSIRGTAKHTQNSLASLSHTANPFATVACTSLHLVCSSLCSRNSLRTYDRIVKSAPAASMVCRCKTRDLHSLGVVFRTRLGPAGSSQSRFRIHRLHQPQSVRGMVLELDAPRRLANSGLPP